MEKIEYSDLNKFLVSVGVALMTISILIVWLFFREPFDLLIEQKTIDNLTETAKTIIITRQGQVSLLLCIIPWVSLILFLLGLTSLIIGLIRWLKKQRLLDERDELTNKKLQKELEKLSEKEVVDKAETEYEQTVDEQTQPTEPKTEANTKEQFIKSYLQVEQTISDKLKLFFSDKYRVLTNYRLKHFEYDIILNAPLKLDTDKIIEIKYYPNGVNSQYIRETLIRLEIAKGFYQETMQKSVKPILIIVLPEDKYNLFEIAKLKETPKQLKHIKLDNLSLHFISQNKLNDLTKERLTSIIEEEE
ncbi:hypothetical protein AAEO57_20795 [Flavobacterium sp. DGU38]|uniref:Uncharacterized protein n=1 Tax=Flavobacterium calami TaxID=3139144 RepID=A0ABU9IUV3_9FLAO